MGFWSDRHCKVLSTIKTEVRNIPRSFEERKEGRKEGGTQERNYNCDDLLQLVINVTHSIEVTRWLPTFFNHTNWIRVLIHLNQVHLTSQIPSTTCCHGNWQVLLLCPWDGTTIVGWLLRKHWTFSKVINKVIIILPATYWIFWKIG
jgi:hypothetical protein